MVLWKSIFLLLLNDLVIETITRIYVKPLEGICVFKYVFVCIC